ncbi:MAG: hypothetical protein WBD36_16685 [Bacteroidota bacterium]
MNTLSVSNKKTSRLNLVVAEDLVKNLNSWANKLNVTLTDLSRKALYDFVEKLERDSLEQELREACRNYRDFNKQFSPEWARFETRIE